MESTHDKEIKILFCTNSFNQVSNGPAKFANLLLDNQISSLKVKILTEDVSSNSNNVFRLELKYFTLFEPFSQFIRMWMYYKASKKINKEFQFDYVVYNNAFIGLLSLIFWNKLTIGMINDDNNVFCNIKKLKNYGIKKVISHYLEKVFCSFSSNNIIVNSVYLKETICKCYNVDLNKVVVFNKGIENKLVFQDRDKINKIKNSILFVKTDFERGGFLTLIEALKKINIEVKLGVVGPTKIQLEKIINLSNFNNVKIIIYGYQNQDVVYDLMREYEVFCVPSYKEAFGVANLEALAFNCKVVATNVGGIPEALFSAPNKWLVEPNNAEELAVALNEAIIKKNDNSELYVLNNFLLKYSSTNLINNFYNILASGRN